MRTGTSEERLYVCLLVQAVVLHRELLGSPFSSVYVSLRAYWESSTLASFSALLSHSPPKKAN